MRKLIKIEKKGIMGPVISVFVMVLVISILAGLTFLFVATLKTQVADTTAITGVTVTNESGAYINITGYTLDGASALQARGFVITAAWNVTNITDPVSIGTGNASVTSAGVVTNSSALTWPTVNLSYTYNYIGDAGAYTAINTTEAAGAGMVNYLALIFLAIIFGAILTIVLKIILPYINLGQSMGGF